MLKWLSFIWIPLAVCSCTFRVPLSKLGVEEGATVRTLKPAALYHTNEARVSPSAIGSASREIALGTPYNTNPPMPTMATCPKGTPVRLESLWWSNLIDWETHDLKASIIHQGQRMDVVVSERDFEPVLGLEFR